MAKKLPIQEIVERFGKRGFGVELARLEEEKIVAPILEQVEILLSFVDDKGLKLTSRGKLSSKCVKEIAHCSPSLNEQRYLPSFKRFIEDEQVASQRVRNLCEVAKIVRVVKGKMLQGSLYDVYIQATQAEKYLYLLDTFSGVNLGYFDGHEEEGITVSICFIMMQTIRDKQKSYRTAEVYLAFLLDEYSFIQEDIEKDIKENVYLKKDSYDVFEGIMRTRLFRNYFVPFGLVEERGVDYQEVYEVQKTALLDSFLSPINAIDMAFVLDKKRLLGFSKRAEKLGIENFFDDFSVYYMRCMDIHFFSYGQEAKEMVKTKKLLGSIIKEQEDFYAELGKSVIETFKYFTQLETKGGGNLDMKASFESWIEGLYAFLPKETPFKVAESIVNTVLFFAQNLHESYDVQIGDENFSLKVKERFNEAVIEDMGIYLHMVGQLEKKLKKSKRFNAKLQESTKEVLSLMVLAVMSVHTAARDGV